MTEELKLSIVKEVDAFFTNCVKETIENQDEDFIVELWNKYLDIIGSQNDIIYMNEENSLNNLFSTVEEALRAAHYGEYSYTDKFFKIDGYGNLESFNEAKYDIDYDILTAYAISVVELKELLMSNENVVSDINSYEGELYDKILELLTDANISITSNEIEDILANSSFDIEYSNWQDAAYAVCDYIEEKENN